MVARAASRVARASSPVARAALAAKALAEARSTRPLEHMTWLPLQVAFLSSRRRVKQIRAGNQTIGKTTPMLAEIVWRCLGDHPFGVPTAPPPITAWVVCASWSQSLEIQKKLWELLPKDRLTENTRWSDINGFAPTKSPVVEFDNGSLIRIKTTGQDALDFAGATIDVIGFDEPPKKPRTFVEALQRVEDRGGVVLLSYTPINAPVDYLRELCEAGAIEDHWGGPLTPEQLIPVGGATPLRTKDGRLKDQAWIDDRRSKTPAHEVEIVIDGAWETRATGAYYSAVWRPDVHVRELVLQGRRRVLLGIDHGHKPGKQVAVLALVDESGEHPCVYVLDEYTDPLGTATPEADARGIIAMLARNGLRWVDVDEVHGDRVHMPGTGSQKSNRDLSVHIGRALGVAADHLRPRIDTVKRGEGRGAGSRSAGERWLYHALVRQGGLTLHPRVVRGPRAFDQYTGVDDETGSKDWMDALRYALDSLIFRVRRGPAPTVRFE